MYELKKQSDGTWKAFVDYGDDFPMAWDLYKKDGSPADLTGQTLVLGIKDKETGTVLCEIEAVITGDNNNRPYFMVSHDIMIQNGMKQQTEYTFDFWNKTYHYTYIKEGPFLVDSVSHNV